MYIHSKNSSNLNIRHVNHLSGNEEEININRFIKRENKQNVSSISSRLLATWQVGRIEAYKNSGGEEEEGSLKATPFKTNDDPISFFFSLPTKHTSIYVTKRERESSFCNIISILRSAGNGSGGVGRAMWPPQSVGAREGSINTQIPSLSIQRDPYYYYDYKLVNNYR